MSSIFGKKDTIAKSWNDMFEEDEEGEEEEVALQTRRANNARSFSHDESVEESKITPRPSTPLKAKVPAPILINRQICPVARPTTTASIKPSNENDPYIWQPKTPRRAPTQVPVDRWSQLGDRRRKQSDVPSIPTTPLTTKKRATTAPSTKKRTGSTFDASNNTGRRQSRNKSNKSRPAWLNQDWRQAKVIDSSDDEDQDQHDFIGGWRHFHL
ncbi:cAMP-dependent protein kinase catalytic subunit [Elasticomyces elasticus]|nr:cAMP-dependent protein kinase catalytic subunit [Elasticomyces elasticus]